MIKKIKKTYLGKVEKPRKRKISRSILVPLPAIFVVIDGATLQTLGKNGMDFYHPVYLKIYLLK